MQMNDMGKIIAGLIIFLIIITFPLWYNIINGKAGYKPELEILTANEADRDACVESTEYMREKHMDLLNKWRDDVVRKSLRVHTAPDGKKYNMSLSFTCMDCHSNKANFCDKCHNYLSVDPYCWECHLTPDDANLAAMKFIEIPMPVELAKNTDLQETEETEVVKEEAH